MSAPYSNLRSKLNRAVVAYLIGAGCGAATDVLPANSKAVKSFPNTVVKSAVAKPEVRLSGIYRITLAIKIKGSSVQSVNASNTELPRTAFDTRVAKTFDALMQTDDETTLNVMCGLITDTGRALAAVPANATPAQIKFAADNADMADFTVEGWFDSGFGDGEPDEEGADWEEILLFDVVCCSSNVD